MDLRDETYRSGQEKRLEAYMELLKGYYRSGEVDKDSLIELVAKAKGRRSMRAFAEAMGVSVATVSRILNGQVTEIRDGLLINIADNADPDSGVTLEQLLDAQGMVKNEDRKGMARKFEEDSRRIIADELLTRGYSVNYMEEVRLFDTYIPDIVIKTDALEKGGGIWIIEVKMTTQYGRRPVGTGGTHAFLNEAMAFYYRGGEAGRISLVVDHMDVFKQVKDRLSGLRIPDEISVILISTAKRKVMDEFIAPLSDGSEGTSIWKSQDE